MSRQLLKIGLVLCCLTLTATTFALQPPFEARSVGDYAFRDDQTGYRLPNETVPETYDISLSTRIDQGQFDFTGTVKINIFVVNTTRQVTVHIRQLTITSVNCTDENGNQVNLLPWQFDVVTEFLTIPTQSDELIKDKRYQLEIQYTGILRTDYGGFYRSSYVNALGTRS